MNGEDYPELKKYRIIRVERVKLSYHWPRHVGKNARKGNHGQYNSDDIFKLFTNQGAIGWALGRNKKDFSDQELNFLQGKLVSELISPEKGIRKDLKGSIMATKKDYIIHTPYNKINILSTVGAGDAYTASVVMGWLNQKPLNEIILEATNLASHVCGFMGSIPSQR